MKTSSSQSQPVLCHGKPSLHGLLHLILQIRKPLPLLPQRTHGIMKLKPQAILICLKPAALHLASHRPPQSRIVGKQLLFKLSVVKYSQLCRRRGSRSPQIRHIIGNGYICFVTYRRNHRRPAVKNRPCHRFFIKGPQILNGSAAPANNQHVQSHLIQCLYSTDNTGCRPGPLNQSRIQNKLNVRIPSGCNIHNIPNGRPGTGCHYSHSPGIAGNRLLILRSKHPHFFQLISQSLKPQKQISLAILFNFPCIQLVFTIPLINIHRSGYYNLLSFLQLKRETPALSGKHHRS